MISFGEKERSFCLDKEGEETFLSLKCAHSILPLLRFSWVPGTRVISLEGRFQQLLPLKSTLLLENGGKRLLTYKKYSRQQEILGCRREVTVAQLEIWDNLLALEECLWDLPNLHRRVTIYIFNLISVHFSKQSFFITKYLKVNILPPTPVQYVEYLQNISTGRNSTAHLDTFQCFSKHPPTTCFSTQYFPLWRQKMASCASYNNFYLHVIS